MQCNFADHTVHKVYRLIKKFTNLNPKHHSIHHSSPGVDKTSKKLCKVLRKMLCFIHKPVHELLNSSKTKAVQTKVNGLKKQWSAELIPFHRYWTTRHMSVNIPEIKHCKNITWWCCVHGRTKSEWTDL